jgi:hypothetical protein
VRVGFEFRPHTAVGVEKTKKTRSFSVSPMILRWVLFLCFSATAWCLTVDNSNFLTTDFTCVDYDFFVSPFGSIGSLTITGSGFIGNVAAVIVGNSSLYGTCLQT